MVGGFSRDYPPQLAEAESQYLLNNLKDWSIAHGLAVRPPPTFVPREQDPDLSLASTAPVTLFPSLFPRPCFEQAVSIQQSYNKLYAAIASDEAWLRPIIEELAGIDDFVAQLWNIHLAVAEEGYAHKLSLGLFRSDYMVHVDQADGKKAPTIKQVEFNTIASSFGGLSSKVSSLHRHLHSIGAYPPSLDSVIQDSSLLQSKSVPSLAAGLAAAHKAYTPSSSDRRTCVIFLVQDPERNVFDQRHLQYALSATHGITVFRLPFSSILSDTSLASDRTLLYHAPHRANATPYEVSTIYFRAGYSPDEYSAPTSWPARLHLERSRATKCPSILTQLAGCKKIQQVLATPSSPHLSRFLPCPTEAAAVLATFAPIYPMDASPSGSEARALARDPVSAARFVLKPQREGGGNNVYRAAIPTFLARTPEPQWPAYILMEMIEPPAQRNVIFRNGRLESGGVICELGVYGVALWETGSGSLRENWEAGYLLRTKGDSSEEGGVAAGFGAVDSCCLVDL